MPETDAARLRLLATHSVAVILAGQSPGGAYVASPNFPVYRYSWLRDGAFIADAMSRAGEVTSAEAFFGWCGRVLDARAGRVDALIERARMGERIPTADHLHTRYSLDGDESDAEWWNFQLDGYGAWLWALGEHHRRHRRSVAPFVRGATVSAHYIEAFWREASYDWWEEHPEERHVSTLAAMSAGLRAVAELPGIDDEGAVGFGSSGAAIRDTLRAEADRLGYLPKWLGGDAVDASLLAVGAAFGVFEPTDPAVLATVARIEAELVHGGGVHRYLADTYYGGGEWLLLAGFLGLQYAASGRSEGARAQLAWIADHATADGLLPEQVDDHLLAPERCAEWLERWGPVATPLLWSHAMYLSLAVQLGLAAPDAVSLP
jgi:GH15 family glucan-1,4-alpha-glucosidase